MEHTTRAAQIRSVHLRDFRGFRDLDLTLPDAPVVVLTGVNGSGKSSVLDACASLLSAIPGFFVGTFRVLFPAGGTASIREGADAATWTAEFSVGSETRTWQVRASHLAEKRPAPPEMSAFAALLGRTDPPGDLPVISYLYASSTRAAPAIRGSNLASSDRLRCYEGAFAVEAEHFAALQTWFVARENLENGEKVRLGSLAYTLPDLDAVRRALATFLGALRADYLHDLRVLRAGATLDPAEGRLVVHKRDQPLFLDRLSDGERRLVVLVTDLARRMVVANPHRAEPLGSPGVVLIDEVEMHLHPLWQRRVLPALVQTFPGVQFIVSTHSPQVLASVENAAVVTFDEFRVVERPHHVHGRDSNSILEEEMGTPARPEAFEQRLRALYGAIDADPGSAWAIVRELEDALGRDDPEVTRARTLLELVGA